jgi:hypothetical protein
VRQAGRAKHLIAQIRRALAVTARLRVVGPVGGIVENWPKIHLPTHILFKILAQYPYNHPSEKQYFI